MNETIEMATLMGERVACLKPSLKMISYVEFSLPEICKLSLNMCIELRVNFSRMLKHLYTTVLSHEHFGR